MAEEHGFGHLKAVAPIKPAPTLPVTETKGVRIRPSHYYDTQFSKLLGWFPTQAFASGRTWT
jgi:hypothetical protein